MPDTQLDTTPRRFYCRHIFTDGHRCGAFCLRGEEFCYYHHTTRLPVHNGNERRSRSTTFILPNPEDYSAIQSAIGEVLQRIASNDIDPRRAGLLLYGLQIASLNLNMPSPGTEPPRMIEEVVEDATFGTIAPVTECRKKEKQLSPLDELFADLKREVPDDPDDELDDELDDEPIPTIQATSRKQPACRPNRRTRRRLHRTEAGPYGMTTQKE
jgi:hypothetical protein